MDKVKVQIESVQPEVDEFIRLRSKVGWGETPASVAETALNNSLYCVVARCENAVIGFGRIVGDGAMFFYIQDLIVDPDYQGLGIGHLLMQQLESYLNQAANKGATVGLLSARDKEDFYARYGYMERTGEPLGLGMCKFI